MPKKIKAIIVSDDCPICDELKDHLKKEGLIKKVKIINADTKKGEDFVINHGLVDSNGALTVPECVIIEQSDGKEVKICTSQEFKQLLKEGK